MIQIDHIVCPIDFSDFSRQALDHAMALAQWYKARVTVVHVHPSAVSPTAFAPGVPAAVKPMVMTPDDREILVRELSAFAAKRAATVPHEVLVVEGIVWREIVTLAETTEADLLVLGTHGRSGFERLLLGSVTEKVLRTAPCPVFTVPRVAADLAGDRAGLFKHILYATDFSPTSAAAGKWAMSLAQEADAELLVLNVMETPFVPDVEPFPRSAIASYRRDYEEWSAARLREAVPEAVRTSCTVREVLGAGSAHREILRIAAEHGSELIVMGVAGHRSLGDRMFGSTTQQVVRAAACPVLTVRES